MPEIHIAHAVVGDADAPTDDVCVRWSDEGIITDIEPASGAAVEPGWAVPGYLDTHTHGAVGYDFGHADEAQALAILEHHHRHGATSVFASVATDAPERMIAQARMLASLCDRGDLDGIHLEGPFLAEARKGAHSAELLRDPTAQIVEELIEACGSHLAMVTLAPERDGGLDAVRRFARAGVRVAFGHSDADAATTGQCIDAGARVATHLFNAMAPIHHRSPGPIPRLLTDPRVMCELIADGVHVHADVLAMAFRTAGAGRIALITDSMAATGLGDGDYRLGALPVRVIDGVARVLTDDGTEGAIAGSTLTMDAAFAHAVACGASILQTAHMAAITPARVHGLETVGRLEPGRRADLVIVDERGRAQRVLRKGEWLT